MGTRIKLLDSSWHTSPQRRDVRYHTKMLGHREDFHFFLSEVLPPFPPRLREHELHH